MPHQGNHRVFLVDPALLDVVTRMGMYVRKNLEFPFTAMPPESCITHGMERDGSFFIRVWVEVVIADEGANPSNAIVVLS